MHSAGFYKSFPGLPSSASAASCADTLTPDIGSGCLTQPRCFPVSLLAAPFGPCTAAKFQSFEADARFLHPCLNPAMSFQPLQRETQCPRQDTLTTPYVGPSCGPFAVPRACPGYSHHSGFEHADPSTGNTRHSFAQISAQCPLLAQTLLTCPPQGSCPSLCSCGWYPTLQHRATEYLILFLTKS